MKFNKFVKTAGVGGTIYRRSNGDNWLYYDNTMMKIPSHLFSLTADDIRRMPEAYEALINQGEAGFDCSLTGARMLYPDSGIKDCIRIYSVDGTDYRLGIANNDWSLIDRRDMVQMCGERDENKEFIPSALAIMEYESASSLEMSVVGLIFPAE